MFDRDRERLLALIDLEQWTFILNRFSEVLGVDIYTVDPKGKVVTHPQHHPKLWKLIDGSKLKSPSEIIQNLIQKSGATQVPSEETEEIGVTHAVIPIASPPQGILAYLVIGPLLLGARKSQEELKTIAEAQEWETLELESAYQEIKLFSFVGMKAMMDLLSGVCNYLVQPAALREKKLPETPPTGERSISIRSEQKELENFFSNLLDLALQATKADSGSVMVLDEDSQTLRIRAAHGLKDEVVQQTRIKVGEGVAGWVAEKNESVLIDPELNIASPLKERLKRPQIDSSIIMPLARQSQVFGVLSVNSHTKENRLKTQSLDLLTQLAKLSMVVV